MGLFIVLALAHLYFVAVIDAAMFAVGAFQVVE